MKINKKEIAFVSAVLIFQIIIHLFLCVQKSYLHMDEAYSLGLSSYDKVEIYYNEDFYNNWHEGEYYEDYLCVNEDEYGEYQQVYENQKNDVHPPFYYLFLRFAMGFTAGGYSKWSGLILNVVIYVFITLLNYLIFQRLFKNRSNPKKIALIVAFLGSITMASLVSVTYIRMYAMATLLATLYSYLHIKLKESEKKTKWFVLVGITALLASLTHYYLIFYIFALFFHQAERFIRKKEFKNLGLYVLVLAIAAGLSLAIFPYSIQHMFFGYRGTGFIEKLLDGPMFIVNLSVYVWHVNKYVFNYTMLILLFAAVVLYYLRKNYKDLFKNGKQEDSGPVVDEIKSSLLNPTLFYFLIVSVASPWLEIRYVLPVCINIFALALFYFVRLLRSMWTTKISERILLCFLAFMFVVAPVIVKKEPETIYSQNKDFMESIETEYKGVPAVYMFNSGVQRFLDDILIFATFDKSYIAKDSEMTIEGYSEFLKDVDTSNGIVVVINEGQDIEGVINLLCEANGFASSEHIHHLNAADVYYLK